MRKKHEIEPLGVIRSPYKSKEEIPRQGHFEPEVEAVAVLDEKWREGMKGLELCDRLVFLFLFDRSEGAKLTANAHWLDGEKGVFATRSPNRPNGIGMTEVEVVSIEGLEIRFRGPDMLDGTPLIDIKPVVDTSRSND
ncbi:tRNA (N6-threonylcarbamoyladenosine(37)-N6)-methyltransferase TrmO [Dethiosulfovibrio sp. F2B]|uniref:tRNA (N6-threonylcarbamoyladenosine(37)-N6)-methyltransferase TrmO n=1 Tax=Dethiosulfovibrio faecalis TaxID=2720018 RepID=UPI001F0127A8|nr:tRNA (N6-threonylcarbamoyladenosine(37)-N6)-methyltransferase TrmO [Dethiosulfovibrio faecalis]MCF4152151.1 tRNA (N6-threonylcarbamoyladenosine(37)-N6)-methyltransferase TrmO [Dethiosulfovibrio faecalis]